MGSTLHCALHWTHPELGLTLKKVREFVERVSRKKESRRHVQRLSRHLHRRSESSTQALQKDDMSLVDGGLSRDTFDYAQDLACIDGNKDDFHVHLFWHDCRTTRASQDRSRGVAWVTPLPFHLKLRGSWYVAFETRLFSDTTQPPLLHRLDECERVVEERLAVLTTVQQLV